MSPPPALHPRPSPRVALIISALTCAAVAWSAFTLGTGATLVGGLFLIVLLTFALGYLLAAISTARKRGLRAFTRFGICLLAVGALLLIHRGVHRVRFPFLRPRMESIVVRVQTGEFSLAPNGAWRSIAAAEDFFVEYCHAISNEDGLTVRFVIGGSMGSAYGYYFRSSDRPLPSSPTGGVSKREAAGWYFFAN